MNDKIREIVQEIDDLKKKLAEEVSNEERHIRYKIHDGSIQFDKESIAKHKKDRGSILSWFNEVPILQFLAAPVIYGVLIPFLLFDITIFIYQHIVFRVFKFEFIKRSDYIIFDHHFLEYLNWIEKINCLYCSYVNGLILYASVVAGRTELYFCPIKHAKKITSEHTYYNTFLNYGDGDEYQKKLKALRKKLEK